MAKDRVVIKEYIPQRGEPTKRGAKKVAAKEWKRMPNQDSPGDILIKEPREQGYGTIGVTYDNGKTFRQEKIPKTPKQSLRAKMTEHKVSPQPVRGKGPQNVLKPVVKTPMAHKAVPIKRRK